MGIANLNLQQRYVDRNAKFQVLFLPGFPGERTERSLIDDLKKLKCNIYSVSYPSISRASLFNYPNIIKSINQSLEILSARRLPLMIIAHSFGTLPLVDCYKHFDRVFGTILFSPIIDLNSRFKNDCASFLEGLSSRKNFLIYANLFSRSKSFRTSFNTYKNKLLRVIEKKIPIIYIFGEQDNVGNSKKIYDRLYELRSCDRFNLFLQILIEDGAQKIYKRNIIFPLITSLVLSQELKSVFPDVSASIMGSTVNYRFKNENSDVDLILIKSRWTLDDFNKVRRLSRYYNRLGVKFDISINTYKDCLSSEKIRSNRGPSFLLELSNYFFNILLFKKLKIGYNTAQVLNDAMEAERHNLYQSYKTLMNYHSSKFTPELSIKCFLWSCVYHLYKKRIFNVDQNNIENYFKKNKEIYSLINKCRMIRKHNSYKSVTYSFLRNIVETHAKLVILN